MVKKMRIAFSGSGKLINLKQKRAKIQLQILNTKSKLTENILQTEMKTLNKKIKEIMK